MDYGKLKVPRSAAFESIMRTYELHGRTMSMRKFYDQHVKLLDPNIKLAAWQQFMARFHKDTNTRRDLIIKKVQDGELTELKLEEKTMKGILSIANITIDDIINNPALLESIPLKERVSWLFRAMKSRDSRANTVLKKSAEDRKATMFEDLIKGAQYGEIINDETKVLDQPKEVIFSSESVKEEENA
jgi:hypothetical protein